MTVRVVPLKPVGVFQSTRKVKEVWLKGKELAEEWNVSPAQITTLAKRKHDPLPSDVALGPRRYEWTAVCKWRKRQNLIKQQEA